MKLKNLRKGIPEIITAEWLEDQGACANEVAVFRSTWPEGARINKTNIKKAAALRLDLEFFAESVLNEAALNTFCRMVSPSWRTYWHAAARDGFPVGEADLACYEAYVKACVEPVLKVLGLDDPHPNTKPNGKERT